MNQNRLLSPLCNPAHNGTGESKSPKLIKRLFPIRRVDGEQQPAGGLGIVENLLHGKGSAFKFYLALDVVPIALSGGRLKIYILVQVQRNVNGADDFYSLDTRNFQDSGFDKKLKEYKKIDRRPPCMKDEPCRRSPYCRPGCHCVS